jgi:hypothetical protein
MSALRLTSALLATFALCGCGDSFGDGSAVDEPLIVSNATFNEGALPQGDGAEIAATSAVSGLVYAGGPEKALSGRATKDAYGIALRLQDSGSGYWVVPVGLPDLIDVGTIDWALKFRFTRQAPVGDVTMLIAQTDGKGRFGKASPLKFSVKSLIPDGKKVLSLVWHNRADLDLQVQGPDGKITSAKHPNTGVVPEDHEIPDEGLPGSGTLNRDSNARCVFDGFSQEDVVFLGDPAPGDYSVWVDLYDSCGEPATSFDLQLREDGELTRTLTGRMLDINADNGTGAGLYVDTFSF